MASAVADRRRRASTPEAIEADLSALWRDIARDGPIGCAMMSNLVVFRSARAASDASVEDLFGAASVDAVLARHPSRVILIEHRQESPDVCRPLVASVGILAFGPPSARYGVEQIAVRSACADASLPSILRHLVRGDLPTSVWWMEDLAQVPPLDVIVAIGRQFLYDSRGWRDVRRGFLALAPVIDTVDVVDMNWRRLLPVRRALVRGAESTDAGWWRPDDIRIAHRPGDAALAWLLAGWFSSRLDWGASAMPQIHEDANADDVLSILIGGGAEEFVARFDGLRVLVADDAVEPSSVVAEHEGEADAVAAELQSLSHDVCLHDALSALVRHFRAA